MLHENGLPFKKKERKGRGSHWLTDTGKASFSTNILSGPGDK